MRVSSSFWTDTPRFIRFLLIGGLNTLFGYGCYALLLWVGFHYAWAAILGTICGICFNFFSTGKLVFSSHRARNMPRFIAVYALICAINVAALRILDGFHFNPYFSGLLLILPMAALSFLLMRKFVFRGEHAVH